MHLVKPFQIAAIHRAMADPRGHKLAVSALIAAPIDAPESPVDERKIWPLQSTLPKGGSPTLDDGLPKTKPEAMVIGAAHPLKPGTTRGEARMKIAGIDKRLVVFGERKWQRRPLGLSTPGAPAPMKPVDLSYASAFGGPADVNNPIGKGLNEQGRASDDMPALESPAQPLLSPENRPMPASFGAMHIAWRQRAVKSGTYDLNWVKTRFPALPDDADPTIYNVTAPDQWASAPFQPGALYRLEGMHPTRPVIEGRLPNLRAHAAVLLGDGPHDPSGPFAAIDMAVDTVIFLPDREMVLLVFRGVTPIGDSDAEDVSGLLLAYENAADPPRGDAHYERTLRQRLSPEGRSRYALDWTPLRPQKDRAALEREAAEDRSALAAAEKRMTEISQAHADRARAAVGLPPEPVPPAKIDPDTFISPRAAEAAEIDIGKLIDSMDRKVAEAKTQAEDVKQQAERVRAEAEAKRRQAALSGLIAPDAEDAKAVANAQKAAETVIADPLITAGDEKADIKLRQAAAERLARRYAQKVGAPSPSPALRASLRAKVTGWLAEGTPLAGRDLAGADLSGLDLSGRDLTGTCLERALLTKAKLSGAVIKQAVLTEAVLDHADLSGCDLDEVNLCGASATGARFDGASMKRVTASALRAASASFSNAVIEDVSLDAVDLKGADLSGATLRQVALISPIFERVDARGAHFELGVIYGARIDHATFEAATFVRFALSECDGDQVSFARGDLRGLRLAGRNTLTNPLLDGAKAAGSGWSGADLANASAKGVDFGRSDFSKTWMPGSDFRGSNLRNCQLISARLDGSDFSGADLMDASLRKSELGAADFSHASVVGANFLETDMRRLRLAGTRFDPQQAAVLEIDG